MCHFTSPAPATEDVNFLISLEFEQLFVRLDCGSRHCGCRRSSDPDGSGPRGNATCVPSRFNGASVARA